MSGQSNVISRWLVINGCRFTCSCGCNLFHEPVEKFPQFPEDAEIFICNWCGTAYEAQ